MLKSMTLWGAIVLATAWLLLGAAAQGDEVPTLEIAHDDVWHIEHSTHHVQGLCLDDTWAWISSVSRTDKRGFVFRVRRADGQVAVTRELVSGAQIHPGGMQRRDGRLWVPLAEYRPRSTSTVLALDAMSLETRSQFGVADHLGAVAADEQGRLYAANWDSRQIYVFDAQGQPLARHDNPTGVAYQDMKWHAAQLWAAGTRKTDAGSQAVVDVLELEPLRLVRRYLPSGQPHTGGTSFGREGFEIADRALYLMPEDGPETRLYRFPLPQD
ncbi:MAG: hypothetical protein K1X74_02705 [Pirellulales bacterium]|nr:hypothetical protein [Pirellulales bacterium]